MTTVGAAAAEDDDQPAERMELGEAIQYYLLAANAAGLSSTTLKLYESLLKRLLAFARRQRRTWLDELSPALLRAAVADLKGNGGKPDDKSPSNWKGGEGSAHIMISAARALSKCLLRDGIPVADLSVVKASKVPEHIQPRLTRQEFLALEEAARQRAFHKHTQHLLVARDLAILYLLADTGLRAFEFCGLDVGDVDFEAGTVTVRRGKGGKGRTLAIADSDPHEVDGGLTLRAMRTYLFHREERGLVTERPLWLTHRGKRLNPEGLRRVLSSLCDEAGLDGNRPPHAFRRGWFSEAYKSEPMALPILVARMGWSDKNGNMVRVYTRGVDMDLARTEQRPSLARQWRAPGPAQPAAVQTSAHLPAAPPASPQSSGMQALAAQLAADPAFRQALVAALLNGAAAS